MGQQKEKMVQSLLQRQDLLRSMCLVSVLMLVNLTSALMEQTTYLFPFMILTLHKGNAGEENSSFTKKISL